MLSFLASTRTGETRQNTSDVRNCKTVHWLSYLLQYTTVSESNAGHLKGPLPSVKAEDLRISGPVEWPSKPFQQFSPPDHFQRGDKHWMCLKQILVRINSLKFLRRKSRAVIRMNEPCRPTQSKESIRTFDNSWRSHAPAWKCKRKMWVFINHNEQVIIVTIWLKGAFKI